MTERSRASDFPLPVGLHWLGLAGPGNGMKKQARDAVFVSLFFFEYPLLV
jgi:hypothetical protein